MSKLVTMARKKSLRVQEEETLWGTSLERESILIYVTPDDKKTYQKKNIIFLCST